MGTLSLATRHSVLTALTGGASYSNPGVFAQLHLGDPGSAGTANPAAMTTRVQLTFGNAAASRSIATTALAAWPNATVAETLAWWACWSASTGGNHIGNDDMNAAAPVVIGENLQIDIGAFSFSIASSASNLTDAIVHDILNAVCRGTTFSNSQIWVQLHTGAPGAAGTANIAAHSTRVQVPSWGTPSGGAISNSAVIPWTSAPANETYTDISLWSASTGGTFIAPDQLATPHVAVVGNLFSLQVGQLSISIV